MPKTDTNATRSTAEIIWRVGDNELLLSPIFVQLVAVVFVLSTLEFCWLRLRQDIKTFYPTTPTKEGEEEWNLRKATQLSILFRIDCGQVAGLLEEPPPHRKSFHFLYAIFVDRRWKRRGPYQYPHYDDVPLFILFFLWTLCPQKTVVYYYHWQYHLCGRDVSVVSVYAATHHLSAESLT